MLYTTKEIAEMYGGKQKNVTPYMITHTWIPNGLKHIRGKGAGFLYKKEWVEAYLESLSMEHDVTKNKTKIRKNIKRNNTVCFVN